MSDTKENILTTALRMFSRDGYEAVSVSMIAGALGMTKGALYKHYTNKRDIFDRIVLRMEKRDAEHAAEFDLPEGTLAEMPEKYRSSSIEQLIRYSKAQFLYWTQDEFSSDFRKMLTIEQYRSEKMNKLYQQYFASGPLEYVADLLDGLDIENPQEKAVTFYSPMLLLYSVYDSSNDKEAVIALLETHLTDAGRLLTGGNE